MPVDGDGPTSSTSRTKQRTSQACDECHRRKVKCDGALKPDGICSNCRSSGIECVRSVEKKKRGPKAGLKRRPPSEVASLIYSILSAPQSFTLPDDPQATRNMLIDLASYARSLSKKIDQTSSLDSGFGIDPRIQADTHLSDDTNVVLEPVNNTAEPLVSRIRGLELDSSAVAKPNQVTLLQTALDIRDEMEGGITTSIVLRKRPEYWAPYPWDEIKQSDPPFIFPEDSLLRELISLYFSRLHYINPLFHQPLFERQVFEEKLHLQNRIFGATLLAVCANAARCFSDSRTFYLNSQSEHSAGWKYFNQMAMMFLSPVSSEMDAWPWDMAVPCIQLAQSNVLSIQMRSKGSLPSYNDIAECELWKRAFWVVTCFELIHAATINKRKILTPDQLEIDFPRECDDENWFNASDLKLHFVQPAGKPSYMAYWNYILKYLVRFSSLFLKLEEHISDSEGVQVLEDLSRKRIELLNNWFASMPAHLRWDPHKTDQIFFDQSVMIQCTYCQIQIQILRPLLRPGPLQFPALAICANAARSCLPIFEVQYRRPNCAMLTHWMQQLYMSGIILLIELWKETRSFNTPKEQVKGTEEDVYKCLHFLGFYATKYQVAGRLHDILYSMICASNINFSESSSSSLKRVRSQVDVDEPGYQDLAHAGAHSDMNRSSFSARAFLRDENSTINYGMPTSGTNSDESVWDAGYYNTVLMDNVGAGPSGVHVSGQGAWQSNFHGSDEEWASFMSLVDEILEGVDPSRSQIRN